MRRSCRLVTSSLALGLIAVGGIAPAMAQTYTYTVEHPSYGRIGTYTDTLHREGELLRIDTKLRVAVRTLGIVLHREEADRTELWRGDRLVSYRGVTTINDKRIEIQGEARGDGFVITSPSGTTIAPANIYPSTPWSAGRPPSDYLMSTKTGRVEPAKTTGGDTTLAALDGVEVPTRHFEIRTDKHQEVWLDKHGIPVRFRTEEDGTPIEFRLAPEAFALLLRGQ
jgi:hypothetical protein